MKYFFSVLLSFLALGLCAQPWYPQYNNVQFKGKVAMDKMARLPKDTIAGADTGSIAYKGGLTVWNGSSWEKVGTVTSAWKPTGNAGTTPGTDFVGTTDSKALVLKTNNTERMRIVSSGGVNINQSLAVGNGGGDTILWCVGGDTYIGGSYNNQNHGHFNENYFKYTNADNTHDFLRTTPTEFTVGLSERGTFGRRFYIDGGSARLYLGDVDDLNTSLKLVIDSDAGKTYVNSGTVGIGTDSPDSTLTVNGGIHANNGVRFSGLINQNNTYDKMMVIDSTTGSVGYRAIPSGGDGSGSYINSSGITATNGVDIRTGNSLFTIKDTSGNGFGMGTGSWFIGDAPTNYKAAIQGYYSGSGSLAMYADNFNKSIGLSSGGITMTGIGSLSGAADSMMVYNTATSKIGYRAIPSGGGGTNYWSLSGGNINNNSGTNVGIGTSTPISKLHVAGSVRLGDTLLLNDGGYGPTYLSGLVKVDAPTTRLQGVYVEAGSNHPGGNFRFFTPGGFGIMTAAGQLLISSYVATGTEKLHVAGGAQITGNVGIGANAPSAPLDITGDKIRLRTSKTPSSSTDTGNAGDICWDSGYIYVCIATNTWRRATISASGW